MSRNTVLTGMKEMAAGAAPSARVRAPGARRRSSARHTPCETTSPPILTSQPQSSRSIEVRRSLVLNPLAKGLARRLVVYAAATATSWSVYGLLFQSPLATTPSWDGQHFIAIAAHGYPTVIRNYSRIAFFPGLPLLIRFAHLFTGSWDLAAFTVSVVSGAVFVLAASEIVNRRYGARTAERAAVLLSVAPGAFLYGLAYSDVVALAFASLVLLTLSSVNPWRFMLAGFLGTCATLASPLFAIPVCLVILAETFRQTRKVTQSLLTTAIAGMGAVDYLAYAGALTGRWDAWWVAEKAWGQGLNFSNPIMYLHPRASFSLIPATECVTFVLVLVGYAAMVCERVPYTWYLYTAPMIFLGMFDGGNWLNPRILLDAFPLLLAVAVKARGKWFVPICIVSIALMQAGLVLYTWRWANYIAQP